MKSFPAFGAEMRVTLSNNELIAAGYDGYNDDLVYVKMFIQDRFFNGADNAISLVEPIPREGSDIIFYVLNIEPN